MGLFSCVNSTRAEGECSNSQSLNIDVPASDPPSELTNGETNICRIFRVRELITDQGIVRSFEPKTLSIGPYHHGSSRLRGMEWMKLACRRSIFGCNSENKLNGPEIKELANRAKYFYRENITMEPENFAKMLLLDGCFILFTLGAIKDRAVENVPNATATSLENAVREAKSEAMSIDRETTVVSNAMKGKSVVVPGTTRAESSQATTSSDTLEPEEGGQRQPLCDDGIVDDLLLEENQIPFFVLEEIHKLAAGEGETTELLKEKIATYVKGVLRHYPKAIEIPEICSKDFHHLLHLCHMFFRPSQKRVERNHNQAVTIQWHRAMQYREAGVEFRVKDSSTSHSLLDVTFSKGTMKIPHLSIDRKTESIFSNLILFERGCPHAGKYINAYVIFMSQLLSDADDVKLLARENIIQILGHKEEVVNIFSRLNGLAVFDPHAEDYYLKSTFRSVEAHYRCRFNWWMAWLKHNHLTNPCVAIAALLGLLALLCTIIHQLLSILSHFKLVH